MHISPRQISKVSLLRLAFSGLILGSFILGTGILGQNWLNPISSAVFDAPSFAVSTTEPYSLGLTSYQQGNYEQALVLFRQAHLENPDNLSARYYLALTLDKLHRASEAVSHYQFVSLNTENPGLSQLALNRLEMIKQASPETLNAGTAISIVPLKTNKQALMVDATINQKVVGTFIVDTGATYTSISREMAEALNLDLENCAKINITTANGRIEVPKVKIATLSVNGLVAHDVEATVIDVRKGSTFHGLLGLSFIKKFRLTIDPEANRLIFQQI